MALSHPINPILHPVKIADLRPTQITVGMHEVHRKRRQWLARAEPHDGEVRSREFLGTHMVPVVLGPGGNHWVVDHHHLARALLDEGVTEVLVSVLARLNHLPKKRFFAFMDSHNWLHPYDGEGRRCDWSDLPRHVGKMVDDPYRSLAGELRRAGGYAKSAQPYTEFIWADFLRDRIRPKLIEGNFDKALAKALRLARGEAAGYLPGFAGPCDGD